MHLPNSSVWWGEIDCLAIGCIKSWLKTCKMLLWSVQFEGTEWILMQFQIYFLWMKIVLSVESESGSGTYNSYLPICWHLVILNRIMFCYSYTHYKDDDYIFLSLLRHSFKMPFYVKQKLYSKTRQKVGF